jgi:hypothetical protein
MGLDRGSLPIQESPFTGTVARTTQESKPDKPQIVLPPEGAPNVMVVLLDEDALPPEKRDELMASGLGHAALASQ